MGQPSSADTRLATSPQPKTGLRFFIRQVFAVHLRPYWGTYLLVLLFTLTGTLFDMVFPISLKYLIDQAITPRNWQIFGLLLGAQASLYALSSLSNVLLDRLRARLGTLFTNNLRRKMFAHVLNLPARYYERTHTADVIAAFGGGLATLETAVIDLVPSAVRNLVLLGFNIVMLYTLDVTLALAVTLLWPALALLPRLVQERAFAARKRRLQREEAITRMVEEYVSAHAFTRAFGLRDRAISAYYQKLVEYAEAAPRASFWIWMVPRVMQMSKLFIELLVIALGAYFVMLNRISVGALVSFIAIMRSVNEAFSAELKVVTDLRADINSLNVVEKLLSEPAESDESEHPIHLATIERQISIDHVCFQYPGEADHPILNQVCLEIPYGRSLALLGRSGCGKSTLLYLLMRFYDPSEGRILIDGYDLRQVTRKSLRNQIGMVFQESTLFNTTVRENIRLSRPGATDQEVEEAAYLADAHADILGLPRGYDTLAGERGEHLSGGQRQRVALARALLRKPSILLLDEVTSALDPETECKIVETLKNLEEHCMIVSVTHRLSVAHQMDQIAIFDRGTIIEQGTHAELMQRSGLYTRLWRQQSGFQVSEDGLRAEITPQRLRDIPLFENLDECFLEDLAPQFVTEHYEAGQQVITQGDPGEKFYILVRGLASTRVRRADGSEIELSKLQDGDYFGEIALLENVPRTASIHTRTPSLFLALHRQHFLQMLANMPGVRAELEQAARERWLNVRRRMEET